MSNDEIKFLETFDKGMDMIYTSIISMKGKLDEVIQYEIVRAKTLGENIKIDYDPFSLK